MNLVVFAGVYFSGPRVKQHLKSSHSSRKWNSSMLIVLFISEVIMELNLKIKFLTPSVMKRVSQGTFPHPEHQNKMVLLKERTEP